MGVELGMVVVDMGGFFFFAFERRVLLLLSEDGFGGRGNVGEEGREGDWWLGYWSGTGGLVLLMWLWIRSGSVVQ